MRLLTEISQIFCTHQTGKVRQEAKQDFVYLSGHLVLINPSFHGQNIDGCTWAPGGSLQARCKRTVPTGPVLGPSEFIFVNGRRALLSDLYGITDSAPPAEFKCRDPFHESVFSDS